MPEAWSHPYATSSSLLSANEPIILTSINIDSSYAFKLHTNGITCTLRAWLLLFNIMFVTFIHIFTRRSILLVFIVVQNFIVWIHHHVFIYSIANKHFCYFQLEAITNNVFFWTFFYMSLVQIYALWKYICLGVELLDLA